VADVADVAVAASSVSGIEFGGSVAVTFVLVGVSRHIHDGTAA
jgi:hypothetical protein